MLIILLVYLPVLLLGGVEGKMFRPMALTVVCALFTSAPGLVRGAGGAAQLLRTQDLVERRPRSSSAGWRACIVPLALAMSRPRTVGGLAIVLLGAGLALGLRSGEFVPQLDEGDLVIQTTQRRHLAGRGRGAGANMESMLRASCPRSRARGLALAARRWRPTSWGLSRLTSSLGSSRARLGGPGPLARCADSTDRGA